MPVEKMRKTGENVLKNQKAIKKKSSCIFPFSSLPQLTVPYKVVHRL